MFYRIQINEQLIVTQSHCNMETSNIITIIANRVIEMFISLKSLALQMHNVELEHSATQTIPTKFQIFMGMFISHEASDPQAKMNIFQQVGLSTLSTVGLTEFVQRKRQKDLLSLPITHLIARETYPLSSVHCKSLNSFRTRLNPFPLLFAPVLSPAFLSLKSFQNQSGNIGTMVISGLGKHNCNL